MSKHKPLTKDAVLNPFVFVDDVRSAVMGLNIERCQVESPKGTSCLIRNEFPRCWSCIDFLNWFPVFFDEEEVRA